MCIRKSISGGLKHHFQGHDFGEVGIVNKLICPN